MKEDTFDDIIKHKMENLSVKSSGKDSWSLFESKKPTIIDKSIKEDINFDKVIKQKIDNLPSNIAGVDAWATFESFHKDPEPKGVLEEESFDKIIKNSLLHISPSYTSSHWHMMKIKLNTIEERKNTIFVSKIMEFAALFLIIFTFYHWSAWMDSPAIQLEQGDHMQYAHIDTQIKKQEVHEPGLLSTGKKSVPNLKRSEDYPFSNTYNANEILPKSSETLRLTNGSENELVQNPAVIISALQNEEKVLLSSNELVNQVDFSSDVHQVPTLDNEALHSEFALSYAMQVRVGKSKPKYMISAFGSTDVNLINTPFDKLYSKASYNKEALNNSFGVNVSKIVDRFELETGLGYSRRDYQPAIVREAFGQKEDYYSEVSLNKISYDIATIPLNFKYHFINQTNWSVYVMAGAVLNLVMNADYNIDEVKVEGRPAPGRYTPEVARLEKKPFIDGILAGENIKENYFASIGFGFGIEKKICSNTLIYIQPSYQRQILSADIGIGPNKDKIHTSSLQFGVKTLLN